MNIAAPTLPIDGPIDQLQVRFLVILPRIERHAQDVARHLKCPHRRADFIAETVGMCWPWFLGLAARGRDATRFPTQLANLAARAVRSGRRLCGMVKSKDVVSSVFK